MAKCGRTNLSGGGGVGSDELTATANKILKNYTYVGADTDDEIGTGTIESMAGQTVTPDASDHVIECKDKYMTGNITIPKVAGLAAGNVAVGTTIGGVSGTYNGLGNAVAANVLSGKTFSTAALSNASGTMTNYSDKTSTSAYAGGTFRSGTTGYVFASPSGTGYYSSGTYLRIPATNLSAGNIKKGVSILGITGTFQGMVDSPYYLLQANSSASYMITAKGMRSQPELVTKSYSGISTSYESNRASMTMTGANGSDSNGGTVLWRLSDAAISLASYKTLYVKMSVVSKKTWTTPYLGLSTSGSLTTNNFTSSLGFNDIEAVTTYTLNISNLNSQYWFYFYQTTTETGSKGSSGNTCVMYDMWLIS